MNINTIYNAFEVLVMIRVLFIYVGYLLGWLGPP